MNATRRALLSRVHVCLSCAASAFGAMPGFRLRRLWALGVCLVSVRASLENLVIRLPFHMETAVATEVAVEEARHDGHEKFHLYNMARKAAWTPAMAGYLEEVKMRVIGGAHKYPRRLARGNDTAPCAWDCYRRATMLEPLAARILDRGVEGDFCEAGVLFGGISIYMAAMLRARGQLGANKRRMWVADSFAGLPPVSYSEGFMRQGMLKGITSGDINGMLGKYRNAKLTGTRAVVEANFREHLLPFPGAGAKTLSAPPLDGVRFVKGFFNESLPGPIAAEGRKLALLRVDSDIFTSIYETLERLYPLLSVGGYVVFDDWKIKQARAAAVVYRSKHGIRSKIFGSDLNHDPPFWTIDRMAFWRKEAGEGLAPGGGPASAGSASLDERLAASTAQLLGLRSGAASLHRGVCFVGGALAGQQPAESPASAAECYRACERVPACAQFTFRHGSCQLKGPSAMPVREHKSGDVACVSGIVKRGP